VRGGGRRRPRAKGGSGGALPSKTEGLTTRLERPVRAGGMLWTRMVGVPGCVQTQGPRHKDGEGGVRRACHTVFIKKGSQLCFVTSSCEERLGQLSFFASARLGPPPARKYDHAARRRGVTATTATGALHRRTHTVRVPARCRRPGRMGGADDAGQRRAPNAICACVASTHPLASARPTRLHRPGRRYSLGPAPGGGRRWQWTSGRWWAAFRSIGAGGGVGPTTTTTTTAALVVSLTAR
jgi:hypothetical protein